MCGLVGKRPTMPDQLANEMHELNDSIIKLATDAKAVRNELQRNKKFRWIIGIGTVILAILLLITLIAFNRENNDRKNATKAGKLKDAQIQAVLNCVEDWSAKFTKRSDALSKSSTIRTNALDKVVRDVFKVPFSQAELAKDGKAYLIASDEYNAAVKNNPIPPAPTLGCKIPTAVPSTPKTVPTATHTITSTPTPIAIPTKFTQTVNVPGSAGKNGTTYITTTKTTPGQIATLTIIATATVTKTVTPPPRIITVPGITITISIPPLLRPRNFPITTPDSSGGG